jgi:hypothetical protein
MQRSGNLAGVEQHAPAPIDEAMVSLSAERAQVEVLLHNLHGEHVPLAAAAASTMLRSHRDSQDAVSRHDYDRALDIMAAAISRLVPIYSLQDPRDGYVVLPVDLTLDRFSHGATEVRSAGGRTASQLSVRRSDMLSASSLILRTGLTLGLL